MIQAGLSGSVAGHVCSFAALGCLVVEVLSPAPGRAALWSHAVCPAASSAPRGAFAYSVYPLRGLETVSRAARCRSLRAAIALLYGEGDVKGGPVLISGLPIWRAFPVAVAISPIGQRRLFH